MGPNGLAGTKYEESPHGTEKRNKVDGVEKAFGYVKARID